MRVARRRGGPRTACGPRRTRSPGGGATWDHDGSGWPLGRAAVAVPPLRFETRDLRSRGPDSGCVQVMAAVAHVRVRGLRLSLGEERKLLEGRRLAGGLAPGAGRGHGLIALFVCLFVPNSFNSSFSTSLCVYPCIFLFIYFFKCQQVSR